MGANVADPLIFPMAHHIGERYSAETEVSTFDLRGGWKVAHLTQQERDVWLLAHGLLDRVAQGTRWTRKTLLETVRPVVGADADTVVGQLVDRDILMEVMPGTDQAVEFAKETRLVPLLWGLGNSAEEPDLWRIGLPNQPLVGVPHVVYNTWEWSHMYVNLWESCRALAKMNAEDAGVPASPGECDPEAILTEVLNHTHVLLSGVCAYLDVPFDWGKA